MILMINIIVSIQVDVSAIIVTNLQKCNKSAVDFMGTMKSLKNAIYLSKCQVFMF